MTDTADVPMAPPPPPPPPPVAAAGSSSMPPPLAVPLAHAGLPQTMMDAPTQWRRRRRRGDTDAAETDDDTRSVVSSQWQPDAADMAMMHSLSIVEALPVNRMRLENHGGRGHGRRAKKMKIVDLGPNGLGGGLAADFGPPGGGAAGPSAAGGLGGGLGGLGGVGGVGSGAAGAANDPTSMFAEIPMLAPTDEHTGNALLCFLSQDTFVGFVELEHDGSRHVLKLTGSESLTECDKALCNVQDCCGDKAFLVAAQTCHAAPADASAAGGSAAGGPRRKRTFLARSSGVGDYVAFEGRGMRFHTDFVPGDEQRDQARARARLSAPHFFFCP